MTYSMNMNSSLMFSHFRALSLPYWIWESDYSAQS